MRDYTGGVPPARKAPRASAHPPVACTQSTRGAGPARATAPEERAAAPPPPEGNKPTDRYSFCFKSRGFFMGGGGDLSGTWWSAGVTPHKPAQCSSASQAMQLRLTFSGQTQDRHAGMQHALGAPRCGNGPGASSGSTTRTLHLMPLSKRAMSQTRATTHPPPPPPAPRSPLE